MHFLSLAHACGLASKLGALIVHLQASMIFYFDVLLRICSRIQKRHAFSHDSGRRAGDLLEIGYLLT